MSGGTSDPRQGHAVRRPDGEGMTETRPTKGDMMMGLALMAARRSTCRRKQAGCALTDARHLQTAVGYNGPARGLPNGCLRPNDDGACGCVHAEANACVKARFEATDAYVTRAPCESCAQLLLNVGAVRVTYLHESTAGVAGLELLARAGAEVLKMDPARLSMVLGVDATRQE